MHVELGGSGPGVVASLDPRRPSVTPLGAVVVRGGGGLGAEPAWGGKSPVDVPGWPRWERRVGGAGGPPHPPHPAVGLLLPLEGVGRFADCLPVLFLFTNGIP